ncbi:hypothetical protein WMF04_36885 [Sorangium sp. So ce260]|uniref:hypothetical protein n=1 Tax=Sorangium sp. So ce260 TaxID=3133291 RepID=UPI003F60EE08
MVSRWRSRQGSATSRWRSFRCSSRWGRGHGASSTRSLLVYASGALDKTVFAQELDDIARAMDLRVVHVIESPPPGWTGEGGLIGRELLDRHLTGRYDGADVFVCGPEPMMNVVERALRERAVPGGRVHAEHFVLVGSRPPGRRSMREEHIRVLSAGMALILVVAVLLVAAVRVASVGSVSLH